MIGEPLGNSLIREVTDISIQGKPYKRVVTEDGTVSTLSEKDLLKQIDYATSVRNFKEGNRSDGRGSVVKKENKVVGAAARRKRPANKSLGAAKKKPKQSNRSNTRKRA